MNLCIDPYCDRPANKAQGMCDLHYDRWRRGNPTTYPVPDARDTPQPPWCDCPQPDQQPVTMFGWIDLVDVTECGRCHRPPRVAA